MDHTYTPHTLTRPLANSMLIERESDAKVSLVTTCSPALLSLSSWLPLQRGEVHHPPHTHSARVRLHSHIWRVSTRTQHIPQATYEVINMYIPESEWRWCIRRWSENGVTFINIKWWIKPIAPLDVTDVQRSTTNLCNIVHKDNAHILHANG